MGEAKIRRLTAKAQTLESMVVGTPGGRIHVRWDTSASASPIAQLAFFAEFLAALGIFEDFVNTCPLNYCRVTPELSVDGAAGGLQRNAALRPDSGASDQQDQA